MPPRSPDLARAGETMAICPAEPIRRPGDPATQSRRTDGEVRKLTVGREITLSGEITSCDKLIIEGSVEANLNNCRDVEIAELGLFKGTASIEEAEIQGRFEGNLVVRKRLLIKASGRVSGHDPLRPDRDRVRRPNLRRRPGPTRSRARRDPRGHAERARRELTREFGALPRRGRRAPNDRLSGPRRLEPHRRFNDHCGGSSSIIPAKRRKSAALKVNSR